MAGEPRDELIALLAKTLERPCANEHTIHTDSEPDASVVWLTCGVTELARCTFPKTSRDESDGIRLFLHNEMQAHRAELQPVAVVDAIAANPDVVLRALGENVVDDWLERVALAEKKGK